MENVLFFEIFKNVFIKKGTLAFADKWFGVVAGHVVPLDPVVVEVVEDGEALLLEAPVPKVPWGIFPVVRLGLAGTPSMTPVTVGAVVGGAKTNP